MDSDLRKQKRLGPAPIASFEKSFEDNTSSSIGASSTSVFVPANLSYNDKQKMDCGGEPSGLTGTVGSNKATTADAVMKQQKQKQQQQQQQQQTTVSVSTPSKKLHDIGKRPPPLQSVNVVVSFQSCDAHPLGATLGLNTPSTPRIDISRASSSSHHEDSRDSSPENVFEQVGTGTLQEAIGLGFREEGALELRSSTEELYFMDPEQKREEQEKMQQVRKSPVIFKFDEHQTFLQQHQRKDSASSEVAALLCISGRTSRISSVGSQGSAVSRLSAISGVSRSPSPHRMLLETSFCGPKPLENIVDGSIISTVEPPTAEVLEQVLLSRKHDPTQAVFAEGIKIENSPKKKLSNGDTKRKSTTEKTADSRVGKSIPSAGPRICLRKGISSAVKKEGKQVIGVTASGTEYIRINLRPDHMYEDKGLGPNERIIEVGTTSSSGQKKPATLSLGPTQIEQRLTPSSSPKPARHVLLTREIGGSRSPSPATVTISRKSSFCSLFKTKDSPDSPRERSRSRSKSRDRSTPVSQSGTPNKQRSVLAIFKPKRSGSKSKCSSPIDQDTMSQLDGISQVEFKFKSDVPEPRSRPQSRLRYYDTPLDGKSIHIPLHTPPEEKDARQFIPSEDVKESQPSVILTQTEITPTTDAPNQVQSEPILTSEQAPALPVKSPKPPQLEKVHRIENIDAVHNLPRDISDRERTWSLEVQRHSSQESQETIILENSMSTNANRVLKTHLAQVFEIAVRENGVPLKFIQGQQQQQSHQPPPPPPPPPLAPISMGQHSDHATREKRRILFATRLGSGSQEQIFSTQFSLSKTESLSSQLSEQTSIPESPALEGREPLHRSDTVIRRPEDSVALQKKKELSEECLSEDSKPIMTGVVHKKDSIEQKLSEDENKRPVVVMMRKKDSLEQAKRKSKSASEEDDSTNRHSRYIESFDIKKKFQDTSRNSSDSSIKERDSHTSSREDQDSVPAPDLPAKGIKPQESNIPLPQPPIERQSLLSTDEPAESSESERDTEMDPNRIRRHLPRHIGAIEDHESTGLVSQDSYDDELPYVPTTLPEERALGVSLIPMKDRANIEIKTCPVDRPRSTTPMNPACLEEYCGIVGPEDHENLPIRGTKLRISLPRKDSIKDKTQKTKSPRRISNVSGKSWFEFAEQGIRGASSTTTPTHPAPNMERRDSKSEDEPPPPLPPRKPAVIGSTQWISFENIPEKRKPPKRITALPRDSPQDPARNLNSVQYNYVKPEECQCECHGIERDPSTPHQNLASVDLLQQGEDLQPLIEPECQEGIDPSDSSLEYSYSGDIPTTIEQKPYEVDLSIRQRSRRSSNHSQDPDSPDRVSTPHRDNTRPKRSQDFRKP